MSAIRIPCLLNAKAGSAEKVREALAGQDHLDVRAVDPGKLADEIGRLAAEGVQRIAVAGGDGTLRSAASAMAGTPTELAIIPGGTLNHFARHLGIPTEPEKAAAVVRDGRVTKVDVGYVDDRLILNTSSVGVYVLFVRTRERLEHHLGYRLASLLAAVRILWRLRTFHVELEVEGQRRRYETPLVFVGVGEREMKLPGIGERVENGQRGLHLFVVRKKSRARLIALGLSAAARGVPSESRSEWLDSFVVDSFRIDFPRPQGSVAVDGEIQPMTAPLEYRVAREALTVVIPAAQT